MQYHSIPDSLELSKFLIEESSNINFSDEQKQAKNGFQLGLDMLIRLKKYDEVFIALINKKMLKEALMFIKRYKVSVEYLTTESIDNLKCLIKDNRNLMIEYLNM